MKIENLRIRNFRTIGAEQHVDLTQGLTIVGPNSSGKTNILKAIEMLFTGYDNNLGYDTKRDLTFGVSSGQTSLVASFSGDMDGKDKDFFNIYSELNELLEEPKPVSNNFYLYLSFARSGAPMYRFFSNEKVKKGQSGPFSHKQKSAVNILLEKFVCHYVPSSKSIGELYSSLLLPFVKRSVTNVLQDKIKAINENLSSISKNLDDQLAQAGLPYIKAHFTFPNESLEDLISSFEFHLSDPNKTDISRKGMGIQASAILSSFLWITREESKTLKNTIWLIEEPESYLHPELAGACYKMLEQLRSESILITTTHSLGFVSQDPKKVVGTQINNDQTKIMQYETYVEATSSIRRALGVRFGDYYNLGVLNIFVEGKSDREIYQWLLSVVGAGENGDCAWKYARSAEFIDFTGVSGLEGFMKATYEFIYKERPVVTILDGDSAGDDTRRALQNYLGNKNIHFEANKDFVSLFSGFSLEGLFPPDWIVQAHEEHENWFKDYSVDVEGVLQPFSLKTVKNKEQIRSYLKNKAEAEVGFEWASRFKKVFDMVDCALEKRFEAVYGYKLSV